MKWCELIKKPYFNLQGLVGSSPCGGSNPPFGTTLKQGVWRKFPNPWILLRTLFGKHLW